MKYYKSKRGYFYKIVGDKKIRISIQEYKLKMKGGTVESDGNLESSDFEKRRDSAYHGLPETYGKITQEMLDNIVLKVLRKPFFLAGEPVIFFGIYGNSFKYACYYEFENFSKKIIFKDANNKTINILNIQIKYLIELFWGLVNIRKNNKTFMNTLYDILCTYFSNNIQRLQTVVVDTNIIREMMTLSYNTGRKNSYGSRKSLSVFNLQLSKKIINDLRLPKNIKIKLVSDLRKIMKQAEKMRKNKTSPAVIEKYKLEEFKQLAERLNPTQIRTI